MNAFARVLSVITIRHDPHTSQLASLSPAGISVKVDCSTCSVSALQPMHLYFMQPPICIALQGDERNSSELVFYCLFYT
jgi:hypothetical protein